MTRSKEDNLQSKVLEMDTSTANLASPSFPSRHGDYAQVNLYSD